MRHVLKLHTALFVFIAPVLLGAAGVCAALTYDQVHRAIMDGFDRKLRATAVTTAAFFSGEDHVSLMSMSDRNSQSGEHSAEQTPLYQRYGIPMRRIMTEGDLTYHYTVVLKDRSHITYGVDATEGPDHSALGTDEENPPEEAARLWHAFKSGVLSISPVQQFDKWGKLKIANAPIRATDGSVAALVGADVNISVIDKRTRSAFLHVLGAGLLALLFAALMTWFVARRLSVPLERLKEHALRIGRGESSAGGAEIAQPELRRLGVELEALSNSLSAGDAVPMSGQLNDGIQSLLAGASGSDLRDIDPDWVITCSAEALDERVRILRSSALFRALSYAELLVIAQAASLTEYSPGALVVPRGVVPPAALLVYRGAIEGMPADAAHSFVGIKEQLFETTLANDLRADAVNGAACLLIKREHVFTMVQECPTILVNLLHGHIREGW